MKEEKEEEVRLVPCSSCSAPVLPNLTECMFCGQRDPGKLASSSMGEKMVSSFHLLRKRLRSEREIRPNLNVATPLEKLQHLLTTDDRSYLYAIVGTCVILYMIGLTIAENSLYRLGITGTLPLTNGRIWTLFSSLFLHGNFFHLIFNLSWLFYLAPSVMRVFGRSQFFLIYTISGLIGVATSILLATRTTVGSSAAVFGLVGALLYANYQEGKHPQKLFQQFFLYAFLMIMIGTLASTVDNWAHIGGLLGGVISALLLMNYPRNRFAAWVYDIAALAMLVGSALAIVLSILVPL